MCFSFLDENKLLAKSLAELSHVLANFSVAMSTAEFNNTKLISIIFFFIVKKIAFPSPVDLLLSHI